MKRYSLALSSGDARRFGPEDDRASSAGETASGLVQRLFIAQAQRPPDLVEVDLTSLTPSARALLFNDGTVTTFLEASGLEELAVDRLDQRTVHLVDDRCGWLDLPRGTPVVRRRVVIRSVSSGRACAYAESLLVSTRLPSDFISVASLSPKGLGHALGRRGLETRRELLWFGWGRTPQWAPAPRSPDPLLSRTYLVILAERPAILITEIFVCDS